MLAVASPTPSVAFHYRARRIVPMSSETENAIKNESPRFKVVILHNVMSNWTTGDTEVSDVAIRRMRRGLMELGYDVESAEVRQDIAAPIQYFDPREYVVFNWCEGVDGAPMAYDRIPPVLESLGFAYTGADASALNITTDKALTKEHLIKNNVSTPISKTYTTAECGDWENFPAMVKPASEHCSNGITSEAIVDNVEQLEERVQYVLDTWHQPALVEDFIDGAEFNVSLWGNGRLSVLPLAMIDFGGFSDYHERLVSYDSKWDANTEAFRMTPVICPAPVEDELRLRIEKTAKDAYRVMRLRDYGRIDIRVRDGIPYVLDVNSNPDITLEGGFSRSARTAGYDYAQTISRILQFASKRMPKR
ncbi:MAG: ATP-grasp domain-containing protein [Chloroflexi bacterium]|nr:ATP-grasp domain-containing protein [Chloroflexota bacterium]